MRHAVIAAITLSVGRVTKKDTWNGARSEFMRGGGGGVRVAMATENMEAIVGRGSAITKMVWRIVPMWSTWSEVDEEGGGGEGIRPELRRHIGMKKEGTHTH